TRSLRDWSSDVCSSDLHLTAHRKIAAILEQFGFVKLDADAIIARGISSAFFPHGVGHFLGLQVHDVAGFMADPSGKTIAKPEGRSEERRVGKEWRSRGA